MSIKVIDTISPLGDYPVVDAVVANKEVLSWL